MPPKQQPAAPVKPPTPDPPEVIAAKQLCSSWESRLADVEHRNAAITARVKDLETQRTSREVTLRQLAQQAHVAVNPALQRQQQEQEAAKAAAAAQKSKGPAKSQVGSPIAPTTPPVPDDEEVKKQAKQANILFNIFKKKRVPREVVDEAGNVVVEQDSVAKPPEIAEDLWAKVITMRDERLQLEDTLATVRDDLMQTERLHRKMQMMQRVVEYSLNAAKYDLAKAKGLEPVMPVSSVNRAPEAAHEATASAGTQNLGGTLQSKPVSAGKEPTPLASPRKSTA